MRVHIVLEDSLVSAIERFAGPRGRSAYIETAVKRAVDEDCRIESILSGIGSIPDTGHEWDEDPAAWVRAQRSSDPRRVG